MRRLNSQSRKFGHFGRTVRKSTIRERRLRSVAPRRTNGLRMADFICHFLLRSKFEPMFISVLCVSMFMRSGNKRVCAMQTTHETSLATDSHIGAAPIKSCRTVNFQPVGHSEVVPVVHSSNNAVNFCGDLAFR